MGASCHVTPVLNDILDLCRLIWCIWPPAKISWVQFVMLHLWNDILDLCRLDLMYLTPPPKISWMHFITLHHSHSTNQHPAAPDTSAAQCWKAFLVYDLFFTGLRWGHGPLDPPGSATVGCALLYLRSVDSRPILCICITIYTMTWLMLTLTLTQTLSVNKALRATYLY